MKPSRPICSTTAFCTSVILALSLSACNATNPMSNVKDGQTQQSESAEGESSRSYERHTEGPISFVYPSSWTIEYSEDGSFVYFYPTTHALYGDLFMVQKNELGNFATDVEWNSHVKEFVSGLVDAGEYEMLEQTAEQLMFDTYHGYKCQFRFKENSTDYKGFFVLINCEGIDYAILSALSTDTYYDGVKEYKDVIESLAVNGYRARSVSDNHISEPEEDETQPDDSGTDETATDSPSDTEKSELSVFTFNDGTDDSNSLYSRYIGSITNTSDKTHYFVKVKVSFLDADGNVVDTDSTYACGDEGLEPGETTTFTVSVRRNESIAKVYCRVYDYK